MEKIFKKSLLVYLSKKKKKKKKKKKQIALCSNLPFGILIFSSYVGTESMLNQ